MCDWHLAMLSLKLPFCYTSVLFPPLYLRNSTMNHGDIICSAMSCHVLFSDLVLYSGWVPAWILSHLWMLGIATSLCLVLLSWWQSGAIPTGMHVLCGQMRNHNSWVAIVVIFICGWIHVHLNWIKSSYISYFGTTDWFLCGTL